MRSAHSVRMQRSRPFQWNSEVRTDNASLYEHAVYDDDEAAVVQVTRLVRSRSVTVLNIHEHPFNSLSEPLLCAVRDDAFRSGTFSEVLHVELERALTAACVVRLNQLAPKPEDGKKNNRNASRDFVLLSLISPRVVLMVVCAWASRQSVLARMAAACDVISALGNLSAYSTSQQEADFLVDWLSNAFARCTTAETKEELSRLCQFLTQLLTSQCLNGRALISGSSCLEHIVNPMLFQDQAESAYAIVKCCTSATENNSVLLEDCRETLFSTFKLLASNCSFENRYDGKLRDVEGAIGSISALFRSLSPGMARELRCRMKGIVPWFLEWKMGQQSDIDLALPVKNRQGARWFSMTDAKQTDSLLRQYESILLLAANADEHWREEKTLRDLVHDTAVPCARTIWLAALTRQMPLLTSAEMIVLFENVGHGVLPPFFFGEQCHVHHHESCMGLEKWCTFVAFASLGIRALMMLLNSKELRESVSSDHMASSQVTRSFCSIFVAITTQRQDDVPPAFVCSSVFSELFTLVATFGSERLSYLFDHSSVVDVLMMSLLEIAHSFAMRDQKDVLAEVRQIDEMTLIVLKLRRNNPVSDRIAQRVLPILNSGKSMLVKKQKYRVEQ